MTEQASATTGGERAGDQDGWNGPSFTRRLIAFEVVAVLAVGLGRSAVDSVISLIGSLTQVQSNILYKFLDPRVRLEGTR